MEQLHLEEQPTMFETKPVNKFMEEAAATPPAEHLVQDLWVEGEMCCLFADSNVGKSIFAVQVAEQIAKTRKILYFDCELNDKQFQERYTNMETSQMHVFPENFLRATISPDRLRPGDFCKNFLDDLEKEALNIGVDVIILDNLSYACITSENGDDAGNFMLRMSQIKKAHKWSIMVIAHTPKIQPYTPISRNDLAGSKKLFNFFDAVFALGKSRGDDYRYLKQLKCRAAKFKYNEKNVLVFELLKAEDGNLFFKPVRYDEENCLLYRSTAYGAETEDEIMQLSLEGWSVRAIAEKLQIGKSTVQRIRARNEFSTKTYGQEEDTSEHAACFFTYSRKVSA